MQAACLVKYSIFYTRLLCPLIGFKTVVRGVSGERVHWGQNLVVCLQFPRTDKNKATALKSMSLPLTSDILNCSCNKRTQRQKNQHNMHFQFDDYRKCYCSTKFQYCTLWSTAFAGLFPAKLSLDRCWCDSARHSTSANLAFSDIAGWFGSWVKLR